MNEKVSPYFIHIFIKLSNESDYEQLKKIIDTALDWYKYSDNNWLIYTSSKIDVWMKYLKPLVEKKGKLFVNEINIKNHNGRMSQDFWDWLKKER